jgi:hypothetical protein
MQTARRDFELEAARWQAASELLYGCSFGLQLRLVRCLEGAGTSALWQWVDSERSDQQRIDPRHELSRLPEQLGPVESEFAQRLRRRLSRAILWRESLPGVAFAIQSAIDSRFGGRASVCKKLNVAGGVLDRVGRLSFREDPREWRKVGGDREPLSGDERIWLLTALRLLVYRTAQADADEPVQPSLTVADVTASVESLRHLESP